MNIYMLVTAPSKTIIFVSCDSTHPLISELAIAVVCRPLDREGHCTDHQGPLNTDLVHYRTTHEANCIFISSLNIPDVVGCCQTRTDGKKGICNCSTNIRHLRSCETTTTEPL